MISKSIRIETPRKAGEEIELFLQDAPPYHNSCQAHIHNAVELLYVKNGSYTVILDNYKYQIKKGDLTLFCSGAIHNVFANGEAENRYYVIKIPPSFFMDLTKRESGAEYVMRFAINSKENKILWNENELKNTEIKAVLDRLITEYENPSYASEIAIKLKIMELLLAILRDSGYNKNRFGDKISELIYGVMGYVQEHYSEDIDEKSLAQSLGLSYSYFSRSFKRVTSSTFKNYLNKTRIRKAEQLLCTSDKTISEIATLCGYNSISYFISVYKSITGRTPYSSIKKR